MSRLYGRCDSHRLALTNSMHRRRGFVASGPFLRNQDSERGGRNASTPDGRVSQSGTAAAFTVDFL